VKADSIPISYAKEQEGPELQPTNEATGPDAEPEDTVVASNDSGIDGDKKEDEHLDPDEYDYNAIEDGVENPGISYSELHFLIPDSRVVFDLIFTLSHITHH
jgi:hypothetical protein